MRKRDKKKGFDQSAAKTVSFQVPVLKALEKRSEEIGVPVSQLVNMACKWAVFNENFYSEMAKYHYLKFKEFEYLKDQAKGLDELKPVPL